MGGLDWGLGDLVIFTPPRSPPRQAGSVAPSPILGEGRLEQSESQGEGRGAMQAEILKSICARRFIPPRKVPFSLELLHEDRIR